MTPDIGEVPITIDRNIAMDELVKPVHVPARESETLTQKAFFIVEDVQVSYSKDKPELTLDLITTESEVPNLTTKTTNITNRTPNRRLLDQFDRLAEADPAIINKLYNLSAANPSKKGVAVLSHGDEYPQLNVPFGVLVSKIASGGETMALTVEQIIQDLQRPEDYSYILILACNPAAHQLDPNITQLPLVYYASDNKSLIGESGDLVFIEPTKNLVTDANIPA
ncbi:hypothetical protein KAZ66_01660 [Candidatus Woesebacteria bacterium]|nr:hypothetical protein [Candidatus Woesebacteria bacterium]